MRSRTRLKAWRLLQADVRAEAVRIVRESINPATRAYLEGVAEAEHEADGGAYMWGMTANDLFVPRDWLEKAYANWGPAVDGLLLQATLKGRLPALHLGRAPRAADWRLYAPALIDMAIKGGIWAELGEEERA